MRAWVSGEPIESIERRFTINPYSSVGAGDVVNFASTTRLYLRAAHGIADVLLLGEGPDEEAIDVLLRRLEAGLPAEAVGLMDLPVSLPRGEYLALHNAGHSTPEVVLALPTEELRRYVGSPRSERLAHESSLRS